MTKVEAKTLDTAKYGKLLPRKEGHTFRAFAKFTDLTGSCDWFEFEDDEEQAFGYSVEYGEDGVAALSWHQQEDIGWRLANMGLTNSKLGEWVPYAEGRHELVVKDDDVWFVYQNGARVRIAGKQHEEILRRRGWEVPVGRMRIVDEAVRAIINGEPTEVVLQLRDRFDLDTVVEVPLFGGAIYRVPVYARATLRDGKVVVVWRHKAMGEGSWTEFDSAKEAARFGAVVKMREDADATSMFSVGGIKFDDFDCAWQATEETGEPLIAMGEIEGVGRVETGRWSADGTQVHLDLEVLIDRSDSPFIVLSNEEEQQVFYVETRMEIEIAMATMESRGIDEAECWIGYQPDSVKTGKTIHA